jgi:DDE superfamily endonuclease
VKHATDHTADESERYAVRLKLRIQSHEYSVSGIYEVETDMGEVSTDRAPAYRRVLDERLPAACHVMEQYANNAVEADHGRLNARLRPMRGLNKLRSAQVISSIRPEPPRPLRTRRRCRPEASNPRGLHRTHRSRGLAEHDRLA